MLCAILYIGAGGAHSIVVHGSTISDSKYSETRHAIAFIMQFDRGIPDDIVVADDESHREGKKAIHWLRGLNLMTWDPFREKPTVSEVLETSRLAREAMQVVPRHIYDAARVSLRERKTVDQWTERNFIPQTAAESTIRASHQH